MTTPTADPAVELEKLRGAMQRSSTPRGMRVSVSGVLRNLDDVLHRYRTELNRLDPGLALRVEAEEQPLLALYGIEELLVNLGELERRFLDEADAGVVAEFFNLYVQLPTEVRFARAKEAG